MQTPDLIAEAEDLLQQAKNRANKLAEAVEPTQLRIVINRLRLFLEQHPEPVAAAEPEASGDAEAKATPKHRGKPKTAEPDASGE